MPLFEFISELSESVLFPSIRALTHHTAEELGELTVLNLCALRILLDEPDSAQAARRYADKTLQDAHFRRWRVDGTDLYVLIYAQVAKDVVLKRATATAPVTQPIDPGLLVDWLRAEANERPSRSLTQRLFVRLDSMFRITHPSIRAIRRLVMDWPQLDREHRRLATTRLLQLLHARAGQGDLTGPLEVSARRHRLTLPGAHDPEQDEHTHRTRANENASAGATSAASVAAVPGGLGAGFDPNGDWGVYAKPGRSKKQIASVTVLKR